MPNEPTVQDSVDPNTDDLDAYTDLFNGKVSIKEEQDDPGDVKPADEADQTDVDDQSTDQDEAPDGDDDSGDDGENDQPKPKKVNRLQERINALTAKAHEAERALEAFKAEQTSKQVETAKQPNPVVQDSAGPDPDAKNPDGSDVYPLGEYDPQYIRDMVRHTIDMETAVQKSKDAEAKAQAEINEARVEIHNTWVDKLAPVAELHEDYMEKTLELETTFDGLDPDYSDYLVQTIKSLDHGPEVLYYFANNLDEAQKFVKMGPLNATLALGEINAMFKGNTRKEAKVSKAPPPPQVNKGSKTRVAVNADTDDLDAFSDLLFSKKK